MDTEIVKLHFTSPLHLGAEGTGVEKTYDFLHSDTLFSAICHGWLKIYGRKSLECLLKEFPKVDQTSIPTPFVISSAFPFVEKSDGTTYFLPKPLKRPPFPEFEERPSQERKEAKKVKKTLDDMGLIDLEFFWEWAKTVEPEDFDTKRWKSYQERFNEIREMLDKSVTSDIRPRVTKDRRTGNSLLYHFGLIYFSEDEGKGKSGLYFLVKCRDEDVENRLKAVLKLLGEIGIGGERSSGYGRFKAEWCELDERWAIPQEILDYPSGRVTLSLYYPSNYDAVLPVVNYGLLRRTGWVESPFAPKPEHRLVVHMFEEGSIFDVNKNLSLFKIAPLSIPAETFGVGALVDVAPKKFLDRIGHSVYRYGLAFTVPVILS